jgi:hypothetical protein
MKSIKGMKSMSGKIAVIILVILLVVCLLFDGNMMNMQSREGFYVLPPPSAGRMINTPPKSAQDLMKSERRENPIPITIKSKNDIRGGSETKMLATGGAALMLLNSNKPMPTKMPKIEGFANPGDCLLPMPVANDTHNSNTPFGMQYAPRHYKQNGKPALFDMVEQPVDSRYPLLVLP